MAIRILVTGGTIDGLDYSDESQAPRGKKSLVPKILRESRIAHPYSTCVLFMRDSKFVSEADREALARHCRSCRERRVLITHGTMTMAATAKFLAKKRLSKTIVLTGAALPASKSGSDSRFNIGFAFAAAQLLQPGVYLAMNGRVFRASSVKKNLATGFFEKEK